MRGDATRDTLALFNLPAAMGLLGIASLHPGRSAPSRAAQEAAMVTDPPHILAINDDQAILNLFRELLEEEGYRVSTRREHDKDLTSLKALAPDLIILDYMWASDDGGWGFLELLKLDPATAAIPIVLCTGALREVEALEPRLAAMDVRVVLKPFDLDQLLGVVRDALDRPSGEA